MAIQSVPRRPDSIACLLLSCAHLFAPPVTLSIVDQRNDSRSYSLFEEVGAKERERRDLERKDSYILLAPFPPLNTHTHTHMCTHTEHARICTHTRTHMHAHLLKYLGTAPEGSHVGLCTRTVAVGQPGRVPVSPLRSQPSPPPPDSPPARHPHTRKASTASSGRAWIPPGTAVCQTPTVGRPPSVRQDSEGPGA